MCEILVYRSFQRSVKDRIAVIEAYLGHIQEVRLLKDQYKYRLFWYLGALNSATSFLALVNSHREARSDMQKNILWTGIEYYSLENCILTISDKGSEIASSIIGAYANELYRVEYRIQTDQYWETIFFEIKTQLYNTMEITSFRKEGKENWYVNGQPDEKFSGCIDIDISLTPFTNTLPINRLKLSEKESGQIMVVYVDILGRKTMPVQQKYTRLSHTGYKYENVPNDFESVITVDDLGLVVKYPGLFERTFITESNYR